MPSKYYWRLPEPENFVTLGLVDSTRLENALSFCIGGKLEKGRNCFSHSSPGSCGSLRTASFFRISRQNYWFPISLDPWILSCCIKKNSSVFFLYSDKTQFSVRWCSPLIPASTQEAEAGASLSSSCRVSSRAAKVTEKPCLKKQTPQFIVFIHDCIAFLLDI